MIFEDRKSSVSQKEIATWNIFYIWLYNANMHNLLSFLTNTEKTHSVEKKTASYFVISV